MFTMSANSATIFAHFISIFQTLRSYYLRHNVLKQSAIKTELGPCSAQYLLCLIFHHYLSSISVGQCSLSFCILNFALCIFQSVRQAMLTLSKHSLPRSAFPVPHSAA